MVIRGNKKPRDVDETSRAAETFAVATPTPTRPEVIVNWVVPIFNPLAGKFKVPDMVSPALFTGVNPSPVVTSEEIKLLPAMARPFESTVNFG